MPLSRREFCLQSGACLGGLLFFPTLLTRSIAQSLPKSTPYITEARYYVKLADNKVRCLLCPRTCLVAEGKRGYCRVRENQKGTYKTLVYGRLCSLNNDPIEKKPLFHFLPGTTAISVATVGCNIHCKFCQNWNISQAKPEDVSFEYYSPEKLAQLTRQVGAPTIAYTYTEPTVFTEYIYDTAVQARQLGLRNVIISNGCINEQPMNDLCQVVDAIKIDFKAFSEKFYSEITDGQLQPVLDSLVRVKQNRVWLEIVNLVIPTHNDDPQMIRQMCQWILKNLGPDVPVHFTRFHPQYRMQNLPPTPVKTLETAHKIGLEVGLKYVYIGNVPGHPAENTYCPNCHRLLIERSGYMITTNNLSRGKCRFCQTPIPGVWS